MAMESVAAATAAIGTEPLPSDLKGACKELESYFFNLLLKSMRQAMVPNGSKGADGFAKDTAYAMLDGQWARIASENEGMGLWKTMYEQLEPAATGVKSPSPKAEKDGKPGEFFPLR